MDKLCWSWFGYLSSHQHDYHDWTLSSQAATIDSRLFGCLFKHSHCCMASRVHPGQCLALAQTRHRIFVPQQASTCAGSFAIPACEIS